VTNRGDPGRVAGGSRIDLAREVPRLTWAARFIRVPLVRAQGADSTGTWLATAALPGRSAVDPGGWRAPVPQ
jgi:kanamycin kinase